MSDSEDDDSDDEFSAISESEYLYYIILEMIGIMINLRKVILIIILSKNKSNLDWMLSQHKK